MGAGSIYCSVLALILQAASDGRRWVLASTQCALPALCKTVSPCTDAAPIVWVTVQWRWSWRPPGIGYFCMHSWG